MTNLARWDIIGNGSSKLVLLIRAELDRVVGGSTPFRNLQQNIKTFSRLVLGEGAKRKTRKLTLNQFFPLPSQAAALPGALPR